jgi:hypothetical protein
MPRNAAESRGAVCAAQARGGPCDTEYLFDAFIDMARVVKEQKKWPGFRPPIPVPEALAVQDLRSGRPQLYAIFVPDASVARNAWGCRA